MKRKSEINELLAKFFSNDSLSREEEMQLNDWSDLHKDEFERLKIVMQEFPANNASLHFDKSKAWNNINSKLNPRRTPLYGIVAAAVVASLLLGLFFIYSNRYSYDTLVADNTSSHSSRVLLPDSSIVILYPGAHIVYKSHRSVGERSLLFKGKAFFDVRHDKNRPFVIKAGKINVGVLGTSFIVDYRSDMDARVFVKSGAVKVSSDVGNLVIHAGEEGIVENMDISKCSIADSHNYFNGDELALIFSDTAVKDVLAKLEKEYSVRIEADDKIKMNRITTRLETEQIDSILTEISYLCRCKYEYLGNRHYKLHYRE